jgi:hypothetical protein
VLLDVVAHADALVAGSPLSQKPPVTHLLPHHEHSWPWSLKHCARAHTSAVSRAIAVCVLATHLFAREELAHGNKRLLNSLGGGGGGAAVSLHKRYYSSCQHAPRSSQCCWRHRLQGTH